jgi:BTB/POZ domain
MSTVPHEAASTTDAPLANLLFDHPGADIILRSHDSYHFRVPKLYIVNSSPILGEVIQTALNSPGNANPMASLPVVQLPEIGKIFHCLLTFIFPVTPVILPTPEEIMELLSVAQKYQMGSVLTHIRDRISQHHPLPTSLEPALRIYTLAQKYGLRPEALQAARAVFLKQSITVEDLGERIGIMSGASLYELWKYHERVQANLASDLTEFRASGAHGTITGLRCTELSSSRIPSWLDRYIGSIEQAHNLFDLVEFNAAMTRHISNRDKEVNCECASIPSQTIREFWEALASVVDGSFENVSVVDVPSCLWY